MSTRIALIPAYEPDQTLTKVVMELKKKKFEIVVVDDGSSPDKTAIFQEIAENTNVIHHSKNSGKGTAIKTGLQFIKDKYKDSYTVVTVDADGQHKIEDVMKVCFRAEREPDVMILGSRKFEGGVPLRSKFGNHVTRFVFYVTTGCKLHDTQTGLRAFQDTLIPKLLMIPGERYEYEMNVLMYFAKSKEKIIEEWIETVYLEKNESSHFNPIKDSYRIYKEILRFSGASLISFTVDYFFYCILNLLTENIVLSNIFARVISASFNYTLNRNLVFKSKNSVYKSIIKYALLAAFILGCNTIFLKVIIMLGINRYISKVIVEVCMFVLRYTVQHKFIFGKSD